MSGVGPSPAVKASSGGRAVHAVKKVGEFNV